MWVKCFKVTIMVLFFVGVAVPRSFAEDMSRDEEISILKVQVQELLKRIEQLESKQEASKQEITEQKKDAGAKCEPLVTLDKLTSKLKIKGRWAAGFYDSGKAGSYPSSSFEAPEAKIQFGFEPDDINKIIMRLNLNNAAFNNLDYFYVDTNLEKFFKLPIALNSRLGRMKLDFGEETWANNPVEGALASNSAGNVSGSDEGLQLSGKIGKDKPLGYSLSISNGTTGIGSDTSTAKAFTGKLSYNILDPLYASASYYNSGSMKSSAAEMGIGGLTAAPSRIATGATLRWSREIWELDLRYDFKKGKILVPAYTDSKAYLRFSYGGFSDDASEGIERSGTFGFLEGLYNITPKIYSAGRISVIDLDSDTTVSLNSITANEYQRYSLGLGYRLTSNTLFKLGYDWNEESGASVDDSDNNLVSAIISSQF